MLTNFRYGLLHFFVFKHFGELFDAVARIRRPGEETPRKKKEEHTFWGGTPLFRGSLEAIHKARSRKLKLDSQAG